MRLHRLRRPAPSSALLHSNGAADSPASLSPSLESAAFAALHRTLDTLKRGLMRGFASIRASKRSLPAARC
jgi:hypothetical protein